MVTSCARSEEEATVAIPNRAAITAQFQVEKTYPTIARKIEKPHSTGCVVDDGLRGAEECRRRVLAQVVAYDPSATAVAANPKISGGVEGATLAERNRIVDHERAEPGDGALYRPARCCRIRAGVAVVPGTQPASAPP